MLVPLNPACHAPLCNTYTPPEVPMTSLVGLSEEKAAVTTVFGTPGENALHESPVLNDSISLPPGPFAIIWPGVVGSNATLNAVLPVTDRSSIIFQVKPPSVLR